MSLAARRAQRYGSPSGPATYSLGRGPPEILLGGTFEGGVRARRGGPGEVELRPDPDTTWGGAWRGRPARWDARGHTGRASSDAHLIGSA